MNQIKNKDEYTRVVGALKAGKFDDQPEIARALATEAKAFAGQYREQQQQKFEGSLDLSPTETIKPVMTRFGPLRADEGDKANAPTELGKYNNAAESGVDIKTGLPAPLRATANLLDISPNAQALALETMVRGELERAGVDLPRGVSAVFKDESTGKLAYWRPTEQGGLKPTLVNGYGPDAGDVLSAVDDVIGGAVESLAVGGAFAGGSALSGGNVAAGAVAGAAAGGAANYGINEARQWIAKELGVPQEVIDTIDSDAQMGEALAAAGFELAAPVAAGLARKMWNLGKPLEADTDIGALLDEMRPAKAGQARLKDELGVEVGFNPGSATGDPGMIAAAANVQRDAVGKSSKALKTADIANRKSTKDALLAIHESMEPKTPRVFEQSNQGAAVNRELTMEAREAEKLAATAEADQIKNLDSVDFLYEQDRYASIVEDLAVAGNRARHRENIAWKNFRNELEINPETRRAGIVLRNDTVDGKVAPIAKALQEIHTDSRNALSQSLQDVQTRFVEDLGYKEGDDFIEGLAGMQLDVNQLHKTVSHLKEAKAKEMAGTGTGWKGNDIDKVITAIETQLQDTTRYARAATNRQVKPAKAKQILRTYESAKRDTIDRHNMYVEQGLRNAVQDTANGRPPRPEAVRQLLFKPSNAQALDEAMKVIGSNPAKRSMLTDELNRMYRAKVVKDEKFSQTAHEQFMNSYRGHLDVLVGDEQSEFIRNAADMQRVTKAAQMKAESAKRTMEKAFGTKFTGDALYSGNVAKELLTSNNLTLDQMKNAKAALQRNNPDLWADVERDGLRHAAQSMMKSNDQEANFSALNKMLKGDTSRHEAMFGKDYVKNLEALRDVMAVAQGENLGKASRVVLNPPVLQMARTIFGPLSTTQRRLTAGMRMSDALRVRTTAELVANPERLRSFVKLSKMTPGTVKYVQMAAAAGIPDEALDPESQQMSARLKEMSEMVSPKVSFPRGF